MAEAGTSLGVRTPPDSRAADGRVSTQPAGGDLGSMRDSVAPGSQVAPPDIVQPQGAALPQPDDNPTASPPIDTSAPPAQPPETGDRRMFDYPSVPTGFEVNLGAVRSAYPFERDVFR